MNIITRSLWANHRALTNRYAPVVSRMKFWRRMVFAAADYYFAGLRPSVAVAEKFDAQINKLARYIVGAVPRSEETKDRFCIRRNSEVARVKNLAGFDFRGRWGLKLATWVEHIHRHPESPAFALLESQDDSWLRERRIDVGMFGSARSIHSGETRTRESGSVLRWGSVWIEKVQFLSDDGWNNPSSCKTLSRSRADLIVRLFLSRSSGLLAIRD